MAKASYLGVKPVLPIGYTRLDYIQSDGGQYIDTSVPSQSGLSFSCRVAFTGNQTSYVTGAYSNNRFYIFSVADLVPRYGYVNFYTASSALSVDTVYDVDVTFNQGSQSLTIDGATLVSSSETTTFSNGNSVYLFAYNNSGTASEGSSIRLYSASYSVNGSLVRDYVPCKNASNEVGMFDLVSQTFFANKGTGSFVAGTVSADEFSPVARATPKWYFGDSANVARNIVKGYLGDASGVARLFFGTNGLPLVDLPEGALVQINENGSGVSFYLSKHDYESGLNGAGRSLMVRKELSDGKAYDNSGEKNTYASGIMDAWLNSDYLARFDPKVQELIGKTTFYYVVGGGSNTITTLIRAIFLPSAAELQGATVAELDVGSQLPISSILGTIAYYNGEAKSWWTRDPKKSNNVSAWYMSYRGGLDWVSGTWSQQSRPTFTLPATALVNPEPNADGSYTLIV